MTLQDFATRVKEIASTLPQATWKKVWIHQVFEAGFAGMAWEDFGGLLWSSCNAGLIQLSRADLVESFSREDVKRSTLVAMGATFNFVKLS